MKTVTDTGMIQAEMIVRLREFVTRCERNHLTREDAEETMATVIDVRAFLDELREWLEPIVKAERAATP